MLGGNLVFAASQWLLLIVLAKFIGVEAVGQFALGLAVAAPIFAFASLRLRAVQAIDTHANYAFGTYLGFTIAASLVALSVVALIVSATWRTRTGIVILVVALVKGLEMISDVIQGLMQKHEDFRSIALSQFVKGVTGAAGVTLGAVAVDTILPAVAGLVLARLASLLGYDLPAARRLLGSQNNPKEGLQPRFVYSEIRSLFVLAFPIGIVIAMNTLQLSLPRFAIARFLDEAAVGYYSAIAYVVVAVGMVVNAMGQAVLPRLARSFRAQPGAYLRLLSKVAALAAGVGIGGVFVAACWGSEILTVLYTPDFAHYGHLFTWIMIGGALSFVGAIAGVGVTAARSFVSQALVAGVVTTIVFAACYLLVPRYGLNGAAVGVAIGYAVKLCVQGAQILRLVMASRAPQ